MVKLIIEQCIYLVHVSCKAGTHDNNHKKGNFPVSIYTLAVVHRCIPNVVSSRGLSSRQMKKSRNASLLKQDQLHFGCRCAAPEIGLIKSNGFEIKTIPFPDLYSHPTPLCPGNICSNDIVGLDSMQVIIYIMNVRKNSQFIFIQRYDICMKSNFGVYENSYHYQLLDIDMHVHKTKG